PGSNRAYRPRSSTERAEASEASGCAFDSRRGPHFGELAERQGIAVLTRRDRKVAQVRSLHSPPAFAPCGRQGSASHPRARRLSRRSRKAKAEDACPRLTPAA